jgi:uncharacterized membrane protein YgcG
MKRALGICGSIIVTVLTGEASLYAQTPPAPAPTDAAAAANKTPPFKKEELEALLAPIALYPDALLAQIFMASTYPLEIVEAARWSKEHPEVKGDAVAGAVQSQTWDPSVKSLVAFPTVLEKMNDKIDWTQKLGDAFLAQQKEVMQSVQVLRNKAKDTGNLKSTKEVTVKEEPAPAGAAVPQTIIIESPNPEVIQVPVYNSTVVYGAWAYPMYPPYPYYPPGYAYGAAFWSFTAGVVVGGAIWGNCNWGGNDVNIDIDRQNNFNKNEINHNRNSNNRGNSATQNNRGGNKQSWNHDASHRKGVGYKDSATQQKFGKSASQQNLQAREQYRGRADQGRQQMQREGAANQRDLSGNQVGTRDSPGSRNAGSAGTRDLGGSSGSRDFGGNSAGTRDMGGSGSRNSAGTRDMGGSGSRNSASSRDFGGSSRSSSNAFGGAGRSSGASARSYGSRGGMSRGGGGGRRR